MIGRAVPDGMARFRAALAEGMVCRLCVEGDYSLNAINMDGGRIGVLQDSMLAEPARHLTNQGSQILLVPFCTDERQSCVIVARHLLSTSKSTA